MDSYAKRLALAMGGGRPSSAKRSALADHLGVVPNTVKKALDGEKTAYFSVPNHYKAAAYLRVNPEWLATGEGEMTPPKPSYEGMAPVLHPAVEEVVDALVRIKNDNDLRIACSVLMKVIDEQPWQALLGRSPSGGTHPRATAPKAARKMGQGTPPPEAPDTPPAGPATAPPGSGQVKPPKRRVVRS